jgi:hypothetical protein
MTMRALIIAADRRALPCETNCSWVGQPCASYPLLSCLVRDGPVSQHRVVPLLPHRAGQLEPWHVRDHIGRR